MEEGIVLGGVVILGGLALLGGTDAFGTIIPGGGSGGHVTTPLGVAPSKKGSTTINLPSETVNFPAPEAPTIVMPEEPFATKTITAVPRAGSTGGGGKKAVKETSLMKTIRTTGKVPTVSLSQPSYTTAPAPKKVGSKLGTTTKVTESATGVHLRSTYAEPTPRSYQSPYISAPTKKSTSKPTRTSIWSSIGSFFSGLFGGR